MTSERSHEIDGIRGWAAFVVLLFHLFVEVFGHFFPRIELISAALNGRLAVFVFFALSGDALSIAYLRSGSRATIDSLALRRYTRLMIPVALSSFLVWVLMRSGLTFNHEAAVVVGREDWLGRFLSFTPSLPSFLQYVLLDVFSPRLVYSAPSIEYNPMLWTMSVELPGSLLVFLYWYLSTALRRPEWLAMVVAVALTLLASYYALFFVGVVLAHLRAQGVLQRFRSSQGWQIGSPVIVVLAALVDALLVRTGWSRHADILSATSLVFCFYTSRLAVVFFRSRLSRFLGRISFPLYLTHFSVLASLTSWWIVSVGTITTGVALAIIGVSVVVALLLACAFLPVEERILRSIDTRLKRLLVEPKVSSVD